MFDKNDPRTKLSSQAQATKSKPIKFTEAKYGKFYELPPMESDETTKTWWFRGQNFYIAYSEVLEGGKLSREKQQDEYVLLLPERNSRAVVSFGEKETPVDGYSLVIIPAGESEVKMSRGGKVVRLFSTVNEDLADLPINKSTYEENDPNVALFEPWPDPPTGPKVRVYSLDVPKKEGRFGRIWRCSTFMVNYLEPNDGPRDPSKLSPHSHDDFEQCSLALEGEFVHHLRWPWTTDMAQWREDQHETCGSPSVAVIPAGVIHTTQAMDLGINQLVDIFCPPREDFSKQNGWVLNEDEYPMP
ncbi:cupin domain-containing protein [Priestia abyssalis]|uniref:hypothetical protein n=1 Tax=Priestia abyssalis TaxID=1221450 RepID=UPI000995A77B|nr:hypothetical protein [Priestia abyssalis]